ncbi:MAG: hypothetical protein FWD78_02990 [Treponema sp.]|nr:hypothetical protein [Treponema sp.]
MISIKEKPIIFSSPMVKAILEGRKTQTRRVIKPQPNEDGINYTTIEGFQTASPIPPYYNYEKIWIETDEGESVQLKPKYEKGDVLWVRETWRLVDFTFIDGKWSASVEFKDFTCGNRVFWEHMEDEITGWRSPLFLSRKNARLFLKVESVHIERLQEITNQDIQAEGAAEFGCTSYRVNFERLRNRINVKSGFLWENNPWVYVIKFSRLGDYHD